MFKDKQQDDYKKKREAFTENIRKTNRQQIFSKKRNIIKNSNLKEQQQFQMSNTKGDRDRQHIVDPKYAKQIKQFLRENYTMEMFFQLVAEIQNPQLGLQQIRNDIDKERIIILKQHHGMIGIRKLISVHQQPPIQQIIDNGLVPKMIQFVKQDNFPQLQLQATWSLTNVASGTTMQCQSIIDKGGIPLFVSLLLKQNQGIVQQAIWAIGNIASDCTFYRDTILREGGIQNLIAVAKNQNIADKNIIKHVAWAMSNLCRGSPLPKYDYIKNAIPILCQFLRKQIIDDEQVLSDVSWSIGYNAQTQRDRLQMVIESGVLPRVISNLETSYLPLLVPSLRIVGNISTGSSQQTDQILKNNVLEKLMKLLDHHKKIVRRQACWVISNISAGSRKQVQAVFSNQPLIEKLMKLWQNDITDVKKQICYIFSNASFGAEVSSLFQIYKKYDVMTHYSNLLDQQNDHKLIEISLEFGQKVKKLKNLKMNPFVIDLMNLDAVEKIQKLQYHQSQTVYNNVVKILTGYFDIQDPLAVI